MDNILTFTAGPGRQYYKVCFGHDPALGLQQQRIVGFCRPYVHPVHVRQNSVYPPYVSTRVAHVLCEPTLGQSACAEPLRGPSARVRSHPDAVLRRERDAGPELQLARHRVALGVELEGEGPKQLNQRDDRLPPQQGTKSATIRVCDRHNDRIYMPVRHRLL